MSDMRMYSNAIITAEVLAGAGDILNARVAATTRRYGALLQTRVRARASGRPGPRRQTGDYRRSVAIQTGRTPEGGHAVTVGTNSPQGRRLEFGFFGVDSRGRRYSQPPYPHFGPALDETDPEYQAAVAADVDMVSRLVEVIGRGGTTR